MKDRLPNFELLRVVCMFMILILHFLGKGNVLSEVNLDSVNYIMAMGLEFLSLVSVNCFALITGWFMGNKEIKEEDVKNKVVNLWGRTWIYSCSIYLILLLTRTISFNFLDCFFAIFPFFSKEYWFISSYIVLYCLIPFINKMISGVTDKTYMLCVLFIVFCAWPTFFPFADTLDNTQGCGIIWLIFMYLVGAYLREVNIPSKSWGVLYFLCCVVSLVGWLVYQSIYRVVGRGSCFGFSFMGNNSIMIFIASICLFLFFAQLDTVCWNDRIKKIILFLSPNLIGLYLIHEQKQLR